MNDRQQGPDFETILASTIHDMKNSLGMLINAIDGLTQRMETTLPVMGQELHPVQAEARRLNNHLVQLLTLYRMGRGEFAVNPRQVMVSDFLHEAFFEFEAVFATGGLTVDIDCADGLEWVFDENLLMGVVRNALDNLVRHARRRGRLSAVVEGEGLVIRVEDDGEGFPQSIIEMAGLEAHAMDFRDSSTGLGLYFASRVMAGHEHRGCRGAMVLGNGGRLGGGVLTLHLP